MPSKISGTKPKKLTVDFTGVEAGGGRVRVPEGDYLFKIADYELRHKKDDESSRYIQWSLEILKGPGGTGKRIRYITSLKPEALFNLRNMLTDAGFKVPSKSVDVPLEKVIGRQIAGTVIDDEYEGKIKSVVDNLFPAADFESLSGKAGEDNGDEDEDEESTDESTVAEAATSDDEEDDDELELVDDEDL